MQNRQTGSLKIAMVVPPYFEIPPLAYGGLENVVADITNALVEHGHSVTLIGAGKNGTKADFCAVWKQTVPERISTEITHAALTRKAVLSLARTNDVDLVHDHTNAGPLNAAVYATAGMATVVTAHWPITADVQQLHLALQGDLNLVSVSRRQRELAPDLPWVG